MSYVSLLKNIPEFFSQPTGIAAIASLSLHGAIALIVPLMPTTPGKTPETETNQSSVGLIELSPEDQSRLPQIPGTSQVAAQIPQLPMQQTIPSNSNGNTLTILNPSLNNSPINPPLASSTLPTLKSNSGYPINRYPERQVAAGVNRDVYRARLKDLENNNYRYSSNFGSPSNFRTNNTQNYGTSSNFNRSSETQVRRNSEISGEELKDPSPGEIDPGFTVGGEPIPPQNRGDSADQFNQNQKIATNNIPLNGNLSPNQPTEKEGENAVERPVGKQQAQLDDFTKLRQQVSLLHPNSQEKNPIRRKVTTDQSGLEGEVSGRVVLDSQGKMKFYFSGSPSLELQSKAKEYFNTNRPEADKEKSNSYPFSLTFKYQSGASANNRPNSQPESNNGNSPESKPNVESENKDPQPGNAAVSGKSPETPTNENSKPVVINDSRKQLIEKLWQSKQKGEDSSQNNSQN